MKKISGSGLKWLKAFHIFFAGLWLGGAIALTLKQFFINPNDGIELYGIASTLKFVDDFIIIPGGVGSLLSGLIYSIWTNFGWFRHNWIIVKWCINLFGLIFGTFFLGPWLNSLPPIALNQGLSALSDPVFTQNSHMLMIFGPFQAATKVLAIFISAIKPWKRKKPQYSISC